MKYGGNNPKRRIAATGYYSQRELDGFLAASRYTGSPLHKKNAADYNFSTRQVSPRPWKSLCDDQRVVTLSEASGLFKTAIKLGLVSTHLHNDLPKYVWAMDEDEEAYEAKVGEDGRSYHGYRLGSRDNAMRLWVIKEWKQRIN